ncbi:major facilitator superfamily domain-containing protein [Sparassis latifolia]
MTTDKAYVRFSPPQKKVVVAVVSWASLIPVLFVSGSFVPSIPQIARELHSTGSVISLAVTSHSDGRRPVFLASLPCLCAGSLGVGTATSIRSLMVWRVVQAFGASSGLSVGAGVIGNIYKLEERGTAMGIFFGATQLGVALAPVVGSVAIHYASWRVTQYALFFAGVLALILTDVPARDKPPWRAGRGKSEPLRDPTSVRLTDFILLVPLPYTIAARYNTTNAVLIGAFFMALVTGRAHRQADLRQDRGEVARAPRRQVGARGPAARDGLARPRARPVFDPLFLARFVAGRVGIALDLACLFMNGIGVRLHSLKRLFLTVFFVYLSWWWRSTSPIDAELIAAHRGMRNLMVGTAMSGVLPLINLISVAATDGIAAVIPLLLLSKTMPTVDGDWNTPCADLDVCYS